jgi:hypothetical protein
MVHSFLRAANKTSPQDGLASPRALEADLDDRKKPGESEGDPDQVKTYRGIGRFDVKRRPRWRPSLIRPTPSAVVAVSALR